MKVYLVILDGYSPKLVRARDEFHARKLCGHLAARFDIYDLSGMAWLIVALSLFGAVFLYAFW